MGEKIKYLDTYQAIKSDILSGKYPSGTLLPTEMELCEIYGVGRSTLRRALAMLSDESMVKAHQGHGTTVSYSPQNYTHPNSLLGASANSYYPSCTFEGPYTYSTSPLSVDSVLANEELAGKLNLPVGSKVFRVQRIHYVNSRPYAYMVNYVNATMAPDLDKEDLGGHITEYVVRRYGIKRTEVKGVLKIGLADFKVSQFLNIELGTPCYVQARYGYFQDTVYDYSENHYNPEIIEMRVLFRPKEFMDEGYDPTKQLV